MRELVHIFCFSVLVLTVYANSPFSNSKNLANPFIIEHTVQDTVPVQERFGDFVTGKQDNPFDLQDPEVIKQDVEYDAASGYYIITERIGNDFYRAPTYLTFEEYMEWRSQQEERDYFKELAGITSKNKKSSGAIDPIAKIDVNKSLVDRLFGGTEVDIKPQGSIDMNFGYDYQKVENPILPIRQQRQGGFDFDMNIQMNVTGKIGEKMDLNFNYNTQSTFDFENKLKLQYDSDQFSEDEIIKDISAGDVSLPLRSSLIQGSQNLFGFKTDLQFGNLKLTALISQQRSERKNIQIQGGSLLQDFEIDIDEYDENRHFFLSQYNRRNFEPSLGKLPLVNSLFRLKKIEVWITPKINDNDEIRQVVALADLGELGRMTNDNPNRWLPSRPPIKDIFGRDTLPSNEVNSILPTIQRNQTLRFADNVVNGLTSPPYNFDQPKDFKSYRARLLRQNEFTVHEQLGYISLNVKLRPNEVLGVAYEYDYDGRTYKVGEFSNEVPRDSLRVLYTKMLKSSNQRVDLPEWDLMMKNVYPLGAFQVNKEDFRLDIFYKDLENAQGDKRFLPEPGFEDQPLLRVFNLDKLNAQGDPQPDGFFDFVPGLTINPRNGSVMFPVLEPFGTSLDNLLGDPAIAEKYNFPALYDSTITRAREQGRLGRFVIKGSYKASVTSEISLGAFNIPQGSVRVTAGGQVLQEGVDYEIDYGIGRLRILNESYIQSGTPINISYENNNLFSFQKKNMIGLRADYALGKNLNIGGTYLHLFERPFTQKVNVGDDPINNKIYGLDLNYSKEAPFLTKLVDKIPLIDTKAPSNITFEAETAILRPGHSNAINIGDDDGGSVYIDDFEGAASGFDMRTPQNNWVLASIPQNAVGINNEPLFPESELANDRRSGANRALINWYAIDRAVNTDQNDNYTARINAREVFPNQSQQGNIFNFDARTFDITYYPSERGPYNFDEPNGTDFSAGMDPSSGDLRDPESRWAGIMRNFTNNDFEANNFEFIEFWMLNPFGDKADGTPITKDGVIYLHLGTVSEDILKDNRQFYENALPREGEDLPTDQTAYTRVPRIPPITNAFDNISREEQDLGLDGLRDQGDTSEVAAFADWLNLYVGQPIYTDLILDPANDNFEYFDSPELNADNADVLERYRRFNHPQNNSPISANQDRVSNRVEAYTNRPDSEDLNLDKSFEEGENYYQYAIPIESDGLGGMAMNDFVTDSIEGPTTATGKRIWYRMKVPIDYQDRKTIGQINNLRNIQFIRMIFKDFDQRVTFRFAQFDLTRNSWRKYITETLCEGDDPNTATLFDVDAVNIEENGQRTPFNYVLPEGITRENIPGQFSNFFQNEQSLSLRVCDLPDGCARAIYKNVNLDMRLFKRLKMFVHAEEFDNRPLEDEEASVIIRLGTDFQDNYYEYEVPLYLSDPLVGESPSEIVWRIENEVDLPLQLFVETKKERNAAGFPTNQRYERLDPESVLPKFVRVIGNPNIGQVRSIMIGVKNPSDDSFESICTEVWINELRMTGLDERGGAAGLARLNLELADFADIGAAVNYSSVGFGAIDQKLADRSQKEDFSFDLSGTFELGKFFPQKWGIRLPMYASLTSESSTPRFDPNDRDLDLKEKIRDAANDTDRDSIRNATITKTTIKSLNFTNVRKERTGKGKPMPWDISNFSATYAYTQTERRDPIIKSDQSTREKGGIDYSFSTRSKFIQPFKNLSKSKLLKPLTEFNFNPIPNSFSFSTELNRVQGVRQYQFAPAGEVWKDNRFTWDRRYGFQWDFSKSLRLNYSANNQSIVDEIGFDYEDIAPGEFLNPLNTGEVINANNFDSRSKSFREENLRNFGRPKNYSQNVTVTYDLPLKYFPLLDFMTVKAKYTGAYNWAGASLNIDSLGNVISNNQRREITGDLNFEKLYEKVPYLKKINKKKKPKNTKKARNTKDDKKVKDPIKIDPNAGKDKKAKKDKKEKKEREPGGLERALIRPLMAIRKMRLTYEENFSTIVPGFKLRPQFFGLTEDFKAPGTGFVFGLQPDQEWFEDIKTRENDWITNSRFLNQEVFQTHSTTASAKITVEPFKDFRIEVNGSYDKSEDNSRYFKNVSPLSEGFDDNLNVDFREENFRRFGSYNITFMALKTIFKDGLDNVEALFNEFEANRTIISNRLGFGVHDIDGPAYTEGFGRTQQDVLVPSFLAAYTGTDINSYDADWNIFKVLPRPNWQLTYNGLNKLPWFKDIFQTFSLTHGYKSRLQVNSYITDRDWNANDLLKQNDITANYYTELEIPAIIITEEFSPLLGLSIKTKNDMTLDINMRKQRSLTMSFTNNELREMRSSEYTASFGYTLKNVYLGFLPGMEKRNKRKRSRKPKGTLNPTTPGTPAAKQDGRDLIMKFDFSLRDDLSLNHLLDEDTKPIPTRGVNSIRFSPSMDYEVSESLILSLFFDYSKTTPYVSTSYPITNARGGLQVRILFN